METATTLVHKGAMPIAIHAIRTFARHFSSSHRLRIHTDGSPDERDHDILLEAASGMEAVIVTAADRAPQVADLLSRRPLTRALIDRGAYFVKLELPMVEPGPYFYFDSDIVWLRHAPDLKPASAKNAFSTESWSWYYGISNDARWIRARTPRRVNSGFYHIGEPFPFDRMEDMMEHRMFDPTIPYNTDQEIMAYLFHEMDIYHPEDLKRSRVGTIYRLEHETCAALHFPGRMWLPHMDQIEALGQAPETTPLRVRQQAPVPLDRIELLKMRLYMKLANSPATNAYRRIRNRMR